MTYEEKVQEYLLFRRTVKRILYVTGLWPIKQSKLWYRIIPYIQLVISTITTLAIANCMIYHIQNLNLKKVLTIISALISEFLHMYRIYSFLVNKTELFKLHTTLSNSFNEVLTGKEAIDFSCKKLTKCRRLSNLLTFLVWLSFLIILTIIPTIRIMIHEFRHDGDIQYTLIYPSIYPWNTSCGYRYIITYSIEVFTILSLAIVIPGFDTLYVLYIFQAVSQLRFMSYRITHTEKTDDYDQIMRRCIINYKQLEDCRDIIQNVFGQVIICNMYSCAALLCTLIYQLSQASTLTNMQIMRYITYSTAKLVQLWVFGWPGTLLTTESENYLTSVYSSDWIGKSTNRTFILMTLSQKPLVITAWQITIVSVENLARVIRATISYYLLLKTMEGGT